MACKIDMNTLTPRAAPLECCREANNLGPFTREPDPESEPIPMIRGFRRCTICGSRHRFARPRETHYAPDHS